MFFFFILFALCLVAGKVGEYRRNLRVYVFCCFLELTQLRIVVVECKILFSEVYGVLRSILRKRFSSFGLNSVKLVLIIIGLVC